MLSATIETTSRDRRPSTTSPRPTRLACSPYSRQEMPRQMPRCFSRIATRSPRSRTTCRKRRGSVSSPWTRAGGAGGGAARAAWSTPCLLPLPAARAADARFLQAQVELADVVLLQEPRAGVLHDDAAHLQHVAIFRGAQREVGVR